MLQALENEWTLLVFFAGDENLSPAMTEQLKAIKDAGYEKHTNVLIHYDPNKKGVGTFTFDINWKGKETRGTSIGDGKDPLVRNLEEDVIQGAPKGATAEEALKTFLELGLEKKYRAKHYAVILVGHGIVVGNDAFLPDSSPDTAITLRQLGVILNKFEGDVCAHGGVVDLIGLHSCSMSAIEVVYELKGAARYLMATEGISFVGSWPYRHMLKKILLTTDEIKQGTNDLSIEQLIMAVQRLALHNSEDFKFSGISADISLCNLNTGKVKELDDSLRKLTQRLKAGLTTKRGREVITLAHLKAQSYWHETYTDIYDFCHCLEQECNEREKVENAMKTACREMKEKLKESDDPAGFIVRSDYFGPLYQYSHGLSVYFPWAEPVKDDPPLPKDDIPARYEEYKFTTEFKNGQVDDSWLSFLREYFKATIRESREKEDNLQAEETTETKQAAATTVTGSASVTGTGSLERMKTSSQLEKTSGQLYDVSCGCTIKNYPMEFIRSPRAAGNRDPKADEFSSGNERSK